MISKHKRKAWADLRPCLCRSRRSWSRSTPTWRLRSRSWSSRSSSWSTCSTCTGPPASCGRRTARRPRTRGTCSSSTSRRAPYSSTTSPPPPPPPPPPPSPPSPRCHPSWPSTTFTVPLTYEHAGFGLGLVQNPHRCYREWPPPPPPALWHLIGQLTHNGQHLDMHRVFQTVRAKDDAKALKTQRSLIVFFIYRYFGKDESLI